MGEGITSQLNPESRANAGRAAKAGALGLALLAFLKFFGSAQDSEARPAHQYEQVDREHPQFSEHTLEIQDKLNRYFPVTRDGIDGPKTKEAVRKFQKMHHIRVDGVWGQECEDAFRRDQEAAAGGRPMTGAESDRITEETVARENQGQTIRE